ATSAALSLPTRRSSDLGRLAAGRAQMVVAPGRPAQLTDALHGLGGALLQVVTVCGEKLEGLFPAALVAPDRPAQHQLTAQIRAAGGGGPLAGRIDQIADLVH